MRLHFQALGEGHALLVLHGFLGSLDNWQAMSKRLARHFRVYSVDLRNHGRSPHSDVMNYPVMARDVREFVSQHNLAAPFVLGHSMGGKVAMQFAAEYPESLDKFALNDIAPKAYPPTHRPLLMALRVVDLQGLRTFAEIESALAGAVPDPAIRAFLLKNLGRDVALGFRWRIDLDAIIQNYDELTKAVVIERPFAKPVCFIRGGRSEFVTDDDLLQTREVFPRAEFRTIASAGHWVHVDAANEFFDVVTSFFVSPFRSDDRRAPG